MAAVWRRRRFSTPPQRRRNPLPSSASTTSEEVFGRLLQRPSFRRSRAEFDIHILKRTYFIVYTLSESSVYTQEPSRQIMCLMHQITFLLHGFYLLRVKQLGEPLEFLPLYPASK
uniref:Uncharacterized protein n=1 Tax=Oryza sativa subsp. japonica TaxID=39947 RepID=Q2R3C7_ORYSJ|nr:hypothetical protein LOC_Os11g32390 [Oryza sativa Japonica Group]